MKIFRNQWMALMVSSLVLALVGAVLAADSPRALEVTAEELTTAYLKDANQASQRYGDPYNPKEVIVTGTVDRLVDGTYGKIAKLKGKGKAVVSCLLRKEDVPKVKQGEKIRIKGRCRGFFKKDQSIDLNGGVLQKSKE